MEIGKKYKANNFQLIDTQYGKKIWINVILGDKFKIVFADRYIKIIEKLNLKLMNEEPINLTYNGLDDIKNGKKAT